MWYRGLATLPEPEIDGILANAHASAIVAAHTVVANARIVSRFGGKVFQIDTGMQAAYVPSGRASALEIRDGVFTAIYTSSREVLVGPTATGKGGGDTAASARKGATSSALRLSRSRVPLPRASSSPCRDTRR